MLEPIVETYESYCHRARKRITPRDFVTFLRCPLEFKLQKEGLMPRTRSNMSAIRRGVMLHALDLQDRFDAEFAIGGPINEKTGKPFGVDTKAYSLWLAEQNKMFALDLDTHAKVIDMAGQVKERVSAWVDGPGVSKDVTFENGKCVSRVDGVCPHSSGEGFVMLNVAVTDDLDGFEWEARRAKQHYRTAFATKCLGTPPGVYMGTACLVVVETRQPHRVGIWNLEGRQLFDMVAAVDETLYEIQICTEKDNWPTGYEEPRTLPVL